MFRDRTQYGWTSDRRGFLTAVIAGLGALTAALVGVPIVGTLLAPATGAAGRPGRARQLVRADLRRKDDGMTAPLPRPARSWIDTRLPLRALWVSFLEERIPRGARWAYVFGSVCLALLAVQVVTGVAIALVYVPVPDAALASITYLSDHIACGRIVLGIHHWCANIFVGVVLLHVAQTFV